MLEKQQLAERNIKLQSWINFLAGVTFLIPVITLFYKYTGLSLVQIVLISNVSTIVIWLFELPTSVFADISGMKKSLLYSVISNAISAFFIFLFPSLWGFIAAAVFSGLYWSFRSGTGQAFLEENLEVLGKKDAFGKQIGRLMALEGFAGIFTPFLASLLLKWFGDSGYTILAGLDVLFALSLVVLTSKLKELVFIKESIKGFKWLFLKGFETGKTAIINVFKDEDMKTILLYRTFANHVSFLAIISLPLLVDHGMQDWFGGVLVALSGLASVVASNFAYKIGEKKGYGFAWVLATVLQSILLIIASFVFSSWVALAIIIVVFNLFDGLRSPAWNHVLVAKTQGKAIATTRSVVFSVFALYTTFGKQILAAIPLQYALLILGALILVVNIFLSKKIIAMDSKQK